MELTMLGLVGRDTAQNSDKKDEIQHPQAQNDNPADAIRGRALMLQADKNPCISLKDRGIQQSCNNMRTMHDAALVRIISGPWSEKMW